MGLLALCGWWVGRCVKEAACCGVMNGGVAGARGGAGEGLAAVGLCYRGGNECVEARGGVLYVRGGGASNGVGRV